MDALTIIQHKIDSKVETLTTSRNWKWKVTFVVAIISFISIFSNVVPLKHYADYWDALKNHREYFAYMTVLDRAKDLTGDHVYPPLTGLNNRTFRLTTPILVRVFHLYPASIWLYFVQLVLGIVFFKLLFDLLLKILHNDRTSAFYALVAIAAIYPGMSFWVDFSGYGDFFSYFFLFLCLYFRSPLLILLFSQMAFWNDERAFVSGAFVFLWWWFAPQWEKDEKLTWKPNSQMLTVVASWGLYWVIRYFLLEKYLGMHHTYDNSEFGINLPQNLSVFGFKIGWGLEGLWLIPLIASAILIYKKDYMRLTISILATIFVLILSLTIYDTTRSTAYAYLILFPSLLIIAKNSKKENLKTLLLLVALICFLHPLATKTNAIGFFLM